MIMDDCTFTDDLVEVEASRHPPLPPIAIPQCRHRLNGILGVPRVGNDRHDIQDRLGRQSGHGRAPNMMDFLHPWPTRFENLRPFTLEYAGPFGAVVYNLDVLSLGAQ